MPASAWVTATSIAGVADRLDGLDVVPVAVGLDHLADAEVAAELEQALVLVGGVDQQGVAGLAATDDVDVVVHRADHHAVDLDGGVLVVDRWCRARVPPRLGRERQPGWPGTP